jgi:hypothetical protein
MIWNATRGRPHRRSNERMCRLVSQLLGHRPSDAGGAISPLQYGEDVILQLRKFRERLWSRYAAAIFTRRA